MKTSFAITFIISIFATLLIINNNNNITLFSERTYKNITEHTDIKINGIGFNILHYMSDDNAKLIISETLSGFVLLSLENMVNPSTISADPVSSTFTFVFLFISARNRKTVTTTSGISGLHKPPLSTFPESRFFVFLSSEIHHHRRQITLPAFYRLLFSGEIHPHITQGCHPGTGNMLAAILL